MRNIIRLLLSRAPALRGPHVQRITTTDASFVESALGLPETRDVRPKSMAHGVAYYLASRLVWATPLRLIAAELHRVRIRGEALFSEEPFQDPARTWIVTRSVHAAVSADMDRSVALGVARSNARLRRV